MGIVARQKIESFPLIFSSYKGKVILVWHMKHLRYWKNVNFTLNNPEMYNNCY